MVFALGLIRSCCAIPGACATLPGHANITLVRSDTGDGSKDTIVQYCTVSVQVIIASSSSRADKGCLCDCALHQPGTWCSSHFRIVVESSKGGWLAYHHCYSCSWEFFCSFPIISRLSHRHQCFRFPGLPSLIAGSSYLHCALHYLS